MSSPLRWYIPLAEWQPQSCWECPGDLGHDYLIVAAHDEDEAMEMARERLRPEKYESPRLVRVLMLHDEPAPNHKRPCVSRLRITEPRPMPWKYEVLEAS